MCSEQFEYISDDEIVVNAPAKINLSLLIGAKGQDGFHQVHTVMSKIDLADKITIRKTDSKTVELKCIGDYSDGLSTQDNLVCRAAEAVGINEGVSIILEKNIPAGAGLAGGSSDAAAMLLGLNKLLKMGLSVEQMSEKAAGLGSDVAFFLGGPLALCTGRGEKIKKISTIYEFKTILVLPDVNSATKKVYADFMPDLDFFNSQKNKIEQFLDKKSIDLVVKMCTNMLKRSCYRVYPALADLENIIESLTYEKVCLSGSGSAMYLLPVETEIINYYNLMEIIRSRLDCRVILISNNRW